MAVTLDDRVRRVRALICDVDGVLTDAGMYYGPDGEVMKKFNTRDGEGLSRVRERGLLTALVTREDSPIAVARARKLQIEHVFTGVQDKLSVVEELLRKETLSLDDACYVGDDVGDLEVMGHVGLAVAVADAVPSVREIAHHVTTLPGGAGAVREVCELLLAGIPASRR